jgi:hypothetical protein
VIWRLAKNELCARVCGTEVEDVKCEEKRSGMRYKLLLFVAYCTMPASLAAMVIFTCAYRFTRLL